MKIQTSDQPDEFRAFEHGGWEAVGLGYEQHFARLTGQTVSATLDAAGIGGSMRILDVCTGPGMLAAAAQARGAKAVGLDFSSEVVEIARRNVPNADFHQGDAQHLPFDDETFDAVVCGYGIIHVPDPLKALREMYRVLRPGGRMAVSVWEAPGPTNGFGVLYGALKAHGNLNVPLPHGPDFFQFSNNENLISALEMIGLGDSSAQPVAQAWDLEAPLDIIRSVLEGAVRARALLLAQTPAARQAIDTAIVQGMEKFRSPEGRYKVPMPAIVGAGVK